MSQRRLPAGGATGCLALASAGLMPNVSQSQPGIALMRVVILVQPLRPF